MRLDKYAAFAAESRKEIKKLITKGFVTVNGTVIRDCGYDVGDSDEIFCRGKRVVYKKYIYIILISYYPPFCRLKRETSSLSSNKDAPRYLSQATYITGVLLNAKNAAVYPAYLG